MKNKIESIVIVNHNGKGHSATLRFSDKSKDVCISSTNKTVFYDQIEKYVLRVTR